MRFNLLKSRTAAVVTGAAVIVGLGATGATAAGLIGSDDIRNNSVQADDIHRNAIGGAELAADAVNSRHLADDAVGLSDLRPFAQNQLDDSDEVDGLRGEVTQLRTDVDSLSAEGYVGEHWSIVDRNVIGAGDAFLRSGPTAGPIGDNLIHPPYGVGSLGIQTAGATDKAAFGNQVGFFGESLADLNAVGYSVFTTGENNAGAGNNMPSITFEIDPNIEGVAGDYTSLVFAPNESAANTWSEIDATADANGKVWGLSGRVGDATECDIDLERCTWTEVKNLLAGASDADPATIMTVQITKGRDFAFSGAVDGLWINDDVFDFEPTGVVTTTKN
jgi:hypothetical protein